MAFYPFEVNAPHLVYTFLGGFVGESQRRDPADAVVFGVLSAFIKEKLYLGEAVLATIFGIILGPHVSGLIDPYKWAHEEDEVRDEITLEVTRVIIAISVFAVGVELPKKYMLRHWRSMSILLLPAMLYGWFISALFMWALIPGLKFLSCLVIAAAVTPTDPILAQSVIGGRFAEKHVPAHIRHMLSAESGSNDGAAFPFLYIALYLTLDASPGHAVAEWFYATIAYEIILGTVLGSLLGWVARKAMRLAEKRGWIDRQSFVAQYVSLALLSMGGTVLLGSDDLLSAFACGCAFAWDGHFNKATEDAVFSNVVDLLFNSAAFIYIGALIPFPEFNHHEMGLDWWRLFALAICILVARRLPAIIAMYKLIPDIKTFREACFTGWFGPMGVGAVFISTLARHSLPEGDPDADTAQVDRIREVITPITLFLVLSSILTHGLSIPFFSLGRRVHSLTYTWSRNPSIRDQPAWTTHTQRVNAGDTILINRDEEDGEAGDVGLRRISPESSLAKQSDDEPARERAAQDTADEGGGRTPPLAEYREGDHLVVERRNKDTDEIDVEVIRHHFRNDRESRSHSFSHPHSLEGDRGLLGSIMPTLERWASNASSFASRPGTPLPTHTDDQASTDITPAIRVDAAKPSLRARLFGERRPSNESTEMQERRGSPLELSRTTSVGRTIRFAPDSAPSSDTAPGPQGMANYGNAQSGFRRTPGLAMERTSSVRE